MKELLIREQKVNIIEDINELNLDNYIKLLKFYETNGNGENLSKEEFMVKFIISISDIKEEFLLELYDDEMMVFVDIINNLKIDNFVKQDNKLFKMNGIDYTYVIPKKMTMGEVISYNVLLKECKNIYESWLVLLSILIRPAIISKNEFGEDIYIPAKFNSDLDLLNKRKEFILKLPATICVYIVDAFMNGRN